VGGFENNAGAGHVRAFAWNGAEWVQRGTDLDAKGNFDFFGWDVSLSGDGSDLAVGARRNNDLTFGYVSIYHWTGSSWEPKGDDLRGEFAGDGFGYSVSLSGDGMVLAVGAWQREDDVTTRLGYIKIFEYAGAQWGQKGQRLVGETPGGLFGSEVAVSADGNTVSGGEGFNGNGTVRVFRYDSSQDTWLSRGMVLTGEAAGDRFGSSVDISNDGTQLVVGSQLNDGTGTDAGHARVFQLGV